MHNTRATWQSSEGFLVGKDFRIAMILLSLTIVWSIPILPFTMLSVRRGCASSGAGVEGKAGKRPRPPV